MKISSSIVILAISLAVLAGCTAPQSTPAPLTTVTPIPPTATQPGLTPTGVLATGTPAVPERNPAWTFAAADAILGPITVAGDVVYFGSEDGYLYAVSIATHDLKWQFKTGGAVRSQPTLSREIVYIVSDDSYLYAVSITDGAQVWKTQTGKESVSRPKNYDPTSQDWYTSSPVLLDANLFVGSTDGSLYALDAQSGKVVWKFTTDKGFMIRHTPVVSAGMIYFGDFSGDYYAIDAKEGKKAWVFNGEGANQSNGSILVENVLYFATTQNIYALDASSGNKKWSASSYFSTKIPAYDDGLLYIDTCTECSHPIAAFKADTGQLVWEAVNTSSPVLDSPIIGKSNIYLGTVDRGYYTFDKQTGALQWTVRLSARHIDYGVYATAALADGVLYFGGSDGVLYAVNVE